MAEEKKIIIDVETKVDNKGLDNVDKSLENISENSSKAKKGLSDMSDGAKKLTASFKDIAKTLGFVELLKTLKDVFMQNQKVADLFATAMGTVNIVFNQVVDAVTKVVENVAKATNNFEGLTNVLKGSFGVALNAIKLTFYDLKIAVQAIQLAWEKSIFGKGDPAKIKELQDGIDETKNKIIEAGEGVIKNGKLVANNVGKAIDEVGKVAEGTADAISKIDPKKALDKSKAQVIGLKAAKKAVADLNEELAKQENEEINLIAIRDDVKKSLAERTKAGKDLDANLIKQKETTDKLNTANLTLAKISYEQQKTDDNLNAITNAKTEAYKASNAVISKQNENLNASNDLSLQTIDLDKSIIKAKEDRTIKQKEFDASLINSDLEKLEAQKANLQDLSNTELVTLKNNIDRYKEGTQARADAEKEYADRKQEIDNQISATDKAIADKTKENYKKNLDDTLTALQTNLDHIEKYEILSFNKRKNVINKYYDEQKKSLEKAYEEEKKKAGNDLETLIALAKKYNALFAKNEDDRSEKLDKALKEKIDKYKDYALSIISIAQDISSVFENVANHKIAQLDRENAALERQTSKQSEELDRQRAQEDANINASNMSEEQKAAAHRALELRVIAEKNEIEKKKFEIELANFNASEKLKKQAFNRNKAFQISTAIINTAAGVITALTDPKLIATGTNILEAALIGGAGLAQIAKIASTQYEGGTPPELNTLYASPTSISSPASSGPSAGGTGNLGQNQLQLKEGSMKYMKVYVTETDIKSATSRVDVIENRSKIR